VPGDGGLNFLLVDLGPRLRSDEGHDGFAEVCMRDTDDGRHPERLQWPL